MRTPPGAPLQRYTRTAMALHWVVALLIFGLFPLGLIISELQPSILKLRLVAWHKWFGITVLLLVVLRAAWRLTHRAPPLPVSVPPWQARAAGLVHAFLYLLILAIPLSGWAMSSAAGRAVVWWGLLPLPELLAPDRALAHRLTFVHASLNYTMAAVVVVHVAAAIQHQWFARDRVLERMLPGRDA